LVSNSASTALRAMERRTDRRATSACSGDAPSTEGHAPAGTAEREPALQTARHTASTLALEGPVISVPSSVPSSVPNRPGTAAGDRPVLRLAAAAGMGRACLVLHEPAPRAEPRIALPATTDDGGAALHAAVQQFLAELLELGGMTVVA
jgi:hypothetical protein